MSSHFPQVDSSAARILLIGEDEMLLESRQSVFAREGYAVSLRRPEELISLDELQESFALAVLCHSVSEAECGQLISYLEQKNPQIKILLLVGPGRAWKREYAHIPRSSTHPREMLDCVQTLLSGQAGASEP